MINMKRYIKSPYKFPIFFLGVMTILACGFLNKLAIINLYNTEILVAIGFIVLLMSVVF